MTFATIESIIFTPDFLVVAGVFWVLSLMIDGGANRRKYKKWDKLRKKHKKYR